MQTLRFRSFAVLAFSLILYSQSALGSLFPYERLTDSHVSPAAAVADFNEDGFKDLAIVQGTGYPKRDVLIKLGRGDGSFGPGILALVGDLPESIAADDLDDDGHLDLVVANLATDDISVLFGSGDGTFTPDIRYPVGESPHDVAISDLNGDGIVDLIVSNYGYEDFFFDSGSISVLLGDGDGTFGPEAQLTFGPSTANVGSIGIGDFNRDGPSTVETEPGFVCR